MSVVESMHEDLNAVFERGRPLQYGRPDRAHRAVRNVVGVTESAYGVVVVEGEDRVEFVDNAVSNHVPRGDGEGVYALLLDPKGRVTADLYVFNAGERLLCFTPPGEAGRIAEDWRGKTFIQDVTVSDATAEFGTFGVHGPNATEKVASVLNRASTPDDRLSFVRGRMADAGVTVVRGDGLAGEEGFEVVCAADDAPDIFDTLLNRGMNAAPFGWRTWETLTLEAGTPLFDAELDGTVPNEAGVRNALDFEKGCYVGQEVVSRVENQGRPSRRLVGLRCEAVPGAGVAVLDGDSAVGEVTRAVDSPTLDEPIALAAVRWDAASSGSLAVRVGGDEVPAEVADLPFVEGSETSARLPRYD
jgi:aminomethyltransferase